MDCQHFNIKHRMMQFVTVFYYFFIPCPYSFMRYCIPPLYPLNHLTRQNWGKYFAPMHRSDTIYCDRKNPFHCSKSCRQDGSIRTYAGKAKLDETENLQRKIYQSKKCLFVIRWYKDIKKGHKISEEFVQWLNHIRKRK